MMIAVVMGVALCLLIWSLIAVRSRPTLWRLVACCLSAEVAIGASAVQMGFHGQPALSLSVAVVPERIINVTWSPDGAESIETAATSSEVKNPTPAAGNEEPSDSMTADAESAAAEPPASDPDNPGPEAPSSDSTVATVPDADLPVDIVADPAPNTEAEPAVAAVPPSSVPTVQSPQPDSAGLALAEASTATAPMDPPAAQVGSETTDAMTEASPDAPASAVTAITHGTGGGPGTTKMFLPKPTTSRVVFVIDRSYSMHATLVGETSRLEAVLENLIQRIRQLAPESEFEVLMFDSGHYSPLGSVIELRRLSSLPPGDMERAITAVGLGSTTEPVPALLEAFSLKPDELIFLTDGEFSINDEETQKLSLARADVQVQLVQVGDTIGTGMQTLATVCQSTVIVIHVPNSEKKSE